MPVERYASEYNMNHSKRGIALIFNHEVFEIPSLKPRAGTNVDCDNLCKALSQMHFDVKLYKDLRLRDMMQRIEEGLCRIFNHKRTFVLIFNLYIFSSIQMGSFR